MASFLLPISFIWQNAFEMATFIWSLVKTQLSIFSPYVRVILLIITILLDWISTKVLVITHQNYSGKSETLLVSWTTAASLWSVWCLGIQLSPLSYLLISWSNRIFASCCTKMITQTTFLWCIRRVVSQFWCSFITFPLYVIVTQVSLSPLSKLLPNIKHIRGSNLRDRYGYADGFEVQKNRDIRKREKITARVAEEGKDEAARFLDSAPYWNVGCLLGFLSGWWWCWQNVRQSCSDPWRRADELLGAGRYFCCPERERCVVRGRSRFAARRRWLSRPGSSLSTFRWSE